jgi:hypothetical protein
VPALHDGSTGAVLAASPRLKSVAGRLRNCRDLGIWLFDHLIVAGSEVRSMMEVERAPHNDAAPIRQLMNPTDTQGIGNGEARRSANVCASPRFEVRQVPVYDNTVIGPTAGLMHFRIVSGPLSTEAAFR